MSTLAYFDSLQGLIPIRILAVGDWSDSNSIARVQFTATRGPWKRGAVESWPLRRIVPRTAVYRRGGSTYIRGYNWELMRQKD